MGTEPVSSELATAVIYLADAEGAGRAAAHLAAPLAGVVLVVLGVVYLIRGARAKRRAPLHPPQPPWPSHPPQPPWPPPWQPEYPSHQGYQPPHGYYPPPQPYPAGPLPWTGAPPTRTSTHGRTGAILLVIGILLLGVTVVSAAGRVVTEAKSAIEVGECADMAAAGTPNDLIAIDCADPAAVDELASRSETNECPDGQPVGSAKSLYASMSNGSIAYCFIPNLKQGQCYTVDTGSWVFKPADCSAEFAVLVAKRVDGKSDESLCGADAKPIAYPQPPRTYCVQPPS
ncbi:hypothetical protein [Mycolicibacterium komossense]|uniref:Uncharacterized protein n=1 Tax=Mycolicibacterium komossense TaxID=1779 RepID=A0ABT3C9P5_9MYCO|nr:hypothetical protein [Mycolicibacterium komossense]MCV7226158.1 hypothetical protein [Mycolicibacterium komossense]